MSDYRSSFPGRSPQNKFSTSGSAPSPNNIWKRLASLPREYLIGGGILVGIILLGYSIRIFSDSTSSSEIVQGGKVRTIQLEVLNASGKEKLAQRTTDFLRLCGFDVVELGNFQGELYEKSCVIDRAGNKEAALQVARALGISNDRVLEKKDKTLYLDVSVILGKDFATLKPFR